MRLKSRLVTAAASLLVVSILLASHFTRPSKSQNEITGFLDAFGVATRTCVGVVSARVREKFVAALRGCDVSGEFVPISGSVLLATDGKMSSLFPGDVIRFTARVKPPRDFKNPGGFSYTNYLASRGISATAFISDMSKLTLTGDVDGHRTLRWIEHLRTRIASSFAKVDDERLRGLALALTIGDDSLVPEDVDEAFRRSGLAHLLVISGLNVAFVALAIFFVLWKGAALFAFLAVRFDLRRPAAIATIAAVWCYSFIAGGDVSVVRAAIMATVFLAGVAIGRKPEVINSLSIAALIILAHRPQALFDVSFQLSFVAVLSIALFYRPLTFIFQLQLETNASRARKIVRYFKEAAAATIAASLGVTPIILWYFKQASLFSIFANVVAVPFAGVVVTPLSLVSLLLGAFFPLSVGFFQSAFAWSLWPLLKVAEMFAASERLVDLHFSPPLAAIFAFYGLVLTIFFVRKRRMRFKLFGVAVALVVIAASVLMQRGYFKSARLEVTFIDVGQGASALVRTPDDRLILVDGGGIKGSNFDVGKSVIAPFLWQRGISKIDEIVLTHAHPDHYKGLLFILDEFSPARFVWNGIAPDDLEDPEWSVFFEHVQDSDVEISVEQGVFPTSLSKDLNESSIVLRFEFGKSSLLLTGDIGFKREAELIASGLSLDADVMSVPHHGSARSSSTEFLRAVSPSVAVVQAGEGNIYGFPKKETLLRLETAGAEILRTDRLGAVTFVSDGEKFRRE